MSRATEPLVASVTRPLVIGVGNRWRGDDGLGPAVADALARRGARDADDADDVDIVTLDGEPARLVAAWSGRTHVVVIDAIVAGERAGTIHRIDDPDRLPRSSADASTHGGGVVAAVALGRALGRLPERLVVVGVEPARADHGGELSPAVTDAVDDVVRLVAQEVRVRCA